MYRAPRAPEQLNEDGDAFLYNFVFAKSTESKCLLGEGRGQHGPRCRAIPGALPDTLLLQKAGLVRQTKTRGLLLYIGPRYHPRPRLRAATQDRSRSYIRIVARAHKRNKAPSRGLVFLRNFVCCADLARNSPCEPNPVPART